jgi:type VI secretion system protein ImpA
LKTALENVRTLVEKVVKEKRISEPDPVAEGQEEAATMTGESSESGAVMMTVSGPIRGRQDALRRLSEVAEFFQKTEPHSPVSYLVGRAVKWGNMPLEKWLEEVIKDSSVLAQIQETLGVKPPDSG